MAAQNVTPRPGPKKKTVPIVQSFRYGFKQSLRHIKSLLPLSFFFFLPEMAGKLGWTLGIHAWLIQIYKLAIFFFLLFLAMRVTQPRSQVTSPKGVGPSFLHGELLKWGMTLGGLALGAACLYFFYRLVDSPALSFLQEGLWEGAKHYVAWIRTRSYLEMAGTALLLGILPFYFFVVFNFFGYVIVDSGVGAVQAMARSRSLSHDHFWMLTVFYGLCALLQGVGLAAWIVGAIFTFPITVLATIYVYRHLSGTAEPGA